MGRVRVWGCNWTGSYMTFVLICLEEQPVESSTIVTHKRTEEQGRVQSTGPGSGTGGSQLVLVLSLIERRCCESLMRHLVDY